MRWGVLRNWKEYNGVSDGCTKYGEDENANENVSSQCLKKCLSEISYLSLLSNQTACGKQKETKKDNRSNL